MKPIWIIAGIAGVGALAAASFSINLPDSVEAQAVPQAQGLPAVEAVEPELAAPTLAEASPQANPRADANECVASSWESRYRNLGYDHIVSLANGCDAPVECEIRTNVDRAQLFVTLLTRTNKEVLVRQGSSEREFTAWTVCTR
jgi:hypothetical protein